MLHRGDALDGQAIREILVEIVHSGLEIFVGADDRARTARVSQDSGDGAYDSPRPVVQRVPCCPGSRPGHRCDWVQTKSCPCANKEFGFLRHSRAGGNPVREYGFPPARE